MITVNVLVGDREILISSWYSDEGGGFWELVGR